MKTFKEILLEVIPKDCYWEEMDNLTNCPTRYVIEAAELYAQQYREENSQLLEEKAKLIETIKLIHSAIGAIDTSGRKRAEAGIEEIMQTITFVLDAQKSTSPK